MYTDSDGSTGNTSEYGTTIVCTPVAPPPTTSTFGVWLYQFQYENNTWENEDIENWVSDKLKEFEVE